MGRIVFAIYKPHPGKEKDLLNLVKKHCPILLKEGLISTRAALVLRANQGEIIEVFEWLSKEAIDLAHQNTTVMKLWEQFGKICSYETLENLDEAKGVFADFELIDLNS